MMKNNNIFVRNMLLQIFHQMKRHPALIPLFGCIGMGMTMAVAYVGRLALFHPDVCWDKSNPEPFNKYGPNVQYKFFTPTTDYSQLKKEGPDF
uniref:Cytochrome c oxidase subunit NDUFA4 n=1 Tax=Eptatretus burgeri TaxID=7764 RepID=A0A8C4NI09_EPTBU